MKLVINLIVLLGTLLLSAPSFAAEDCTVFHPLEMRMSFRDASAVVHINGYRTRKVGAYRVFKTPPQNPCFMYPFEVSVQSSYGNKVIMIQAKVGETINLEF